MEIKSVIKLLKESLEKLRNDTSVKQFEGGTFRAWKGNVRAILLNGLGKNAMLPLSEFDSAARGLPMPDNIIDPGYDRSMFERRFREALPNVEGTLENIILQLQTFEIPSAPPENVRIEPPKAFIAHGKEKLPFRKAWTIEIQADVQKLRPIIERVANELHIENYKLEARPANSKITNTYVWFDVFAINRNTADSTPIGVLTLESPRSNRTTLRVPPRSQWLHGDLTPRELMIMGYIEKDKDALQFYGECFSQFIRCLKNELKGTPFKLLWQWLKSHKIPSITIAIITLVAAVIYLIDYFT